MVKMPKLVQNSKGLSQVITTLIILVVAVLLAGVVTYYATNVVMTRTTQEEVRIGKPNVWVQEGDNAYAALMIQNLGGRDVLIDKITIRGVESPWGDASVIVQYYRVNQTADDVSGDFELKLNGTTVFAQIGDVPEFDGNWTDPTTDMPLKSSGSMLFFITDPTNNSLHDVGTTISITVYTSNAQWIVETIVQAAIITDVP